VVKEKVKFEPRIRPSVLPHCAGTVTVYRVVPRHTTTAGGADRVTVFPTTTQLNGARGAGVITIPATHGLLPLNGSLFTGALNSITIAAVNPTSVCPFAGLVRTTENAGWAG
jgi:hypothetical protein